jgi:phage baseplate assembly protein W|tara:strand:+ start:362 stop:772 length:411 start_codon:yes stop_codon:yes gene_type:complete
MPLINSSRNISPLDINKNIKVGVALPLNEVNMFKGTDTIKEQAKTNLINVLLTEPGERVYEPTYGVGIKQMLFEQSPNENNLNEKINQQVNIHIPEITIVDTKVNFNEDEHILYVALTYMFNLDNAKDSIQLNFNM